MTSKEAFGAALRELRIKKGLTQEDFAVVSSRTYLSMLERGHKSPTIDKINDLAGVLNVHPLALLAIYYSKMDASTSIKDLLRLVESSFLAK